MPLKINLDALVKQELDKIDKNQASIQAGTDGQIVGSISTLRKGLTITAYVKAVIVGPTKTAEGGVRIDKRF